MKDREEDLIGWRLAPSILSLPSPMCVPYRQICLSTHKILINLLELLGGPVEGQQQKPSGGGGQPPGMMDGMTHFLLLASYHVIFPLLHCYPHTGRRRPGSYSSRTLRYSTSRPRLPTRLLDHNHHQQHRRRRPPVGRVRCDHVTPPRGARAGRGNQT